MGNKTSRNGSKDSVKNFTQEEIKERLKQEDLPVETRVSDGGMAFFVNLGYEEKKGCLQNSKPPQRLLKRTRMKRPALCSTSDIYNKEEKSLMSDIEKTHSSECFKGVVSI